MRGTARIISPRIFSNVATADKLNPILFRIITFMNNSKTNDKNKIFSLDYFSIKCKDEQRCKYYE